MSSSKFPLDIAQLVALYMQCIFYGIVLITVAYGLRVLLWSRDGYLKSRAQISWILVGAIVAMFAIATLEMAFGLLHILQAFIYYTGPGGANGELSNISNWVNVMRAADYMAQTFIGDGIMIYRCYVIYDRNWMIVVVPTLLWLAETACGWVFVYLETALHTPATMDASELVPFMTSVLALTLSMTTVTTGLIAYRILQISNAVNSHGVARVGAGHHRLTRVVRILVESGLIYTISVVLFFITFLASNNAQYGVSDVVVQLIPISFTLILIRVDQGVSIETASLSVQVQTSTTVRLARNPIKLPVRAGMHGNDASAVARADYPGTLPDAYVMDDTVPGGDGDEWKVAQLDSVV